MVSPVDISPRTEPVSLALASFARWLETYGELSLDHQTFFAGAIGGRAKALYYRHKLLGTATVAPLIFFEAFLPGARRLFHHPTRFPIADAHYAMGFAFLYEASSNPAYLDKAIHFLDQLKMSRSAGYKEYCWGYPFDWVTRNGTIKAQTPFITSTPYSYEAFLQLWQLEQRDGNPEDRGRRTRNGCEATAGLSKDSLNRAQRSTLNSQASTPQRTEWKQILLSIARHAARDIKDFPTSAAGSSCSYSPFDGGGVVNAAAYRAFLLTSASYLFSREDYWKIAERNLNFVLENQNDDGSWFYAVDGVRDFVDHFHTCFVMKALAKIHVITGHQATMAALERGVKYYLANLFEADGLPRPFSKAPRLTVYKRELYDCAECINLCLLLQDRFPHLKTTLETVVAGILRDWIKPDGSFRSRQLRLGWDNVPMHRWAQSQMFRSLAFYLCEMLKPEML
jgi:hypothetical protein